MKINILEPILNLNPPPKSPDEGSRLFSQHQAAWLLAPPEEAWAGFEKLIERWGFEFGITQPETIPALTRLMNQSSTHDFQSLCRWSQSHRSLFWQHALKELGVDWTGPVEKAQASPIEPGRWFPESKWDLVSLVFKLNAAENVALRVCDEAGQVTTLTFADLRSQTARWSHHFSQLGFVPGDALGFCAPMNATSTAAFLGALDAGLIIVCIAESFSEQEMESRLRLSQARGLIFQSSMLRSGKVVDLKSKSQNLCKSLQIVSVDVQDPSSALPSALPLTLQQKSRSSTQALLYLFSSGTTGEPKVIPWTPLTPLKAAVDALYHQGFKPGDRVAWPTSWGWMMGPWLLFASFLNRCSLVLFDGAPHHADFLDWIAASRASHLGVVPSLVKAWIQQGVLPKLRSSALEVLSSTGECSNRKDMFLLSHACGFRPIIEYCGGTEIGGAYVSNHRTHPNIPSSFFGPTLGLDFVILDPQGQETSQGEVFLIPPSLGLSESLVGRNHDEVYYKKAPRHPRAPLRAHGDELLKIRDGFYRALGRMDDTMNLGGIKVSAVEIERALHGIPGLHDVAAVAKNPEGGGPSQLILFAVIEDSKQSPEIEKLAQARIRERLNPLFKVAELRCVEKLPRTASNKLMRRLLR